MKMILVTRAQMEACNRAVPRKHYRCRVCKASYAHDEAYRHWADKCQEGKRG